MQYKPYIKPHNHQRIRVEPPFHFHHHYYVCSFLFFALCFLLMLHRVFYCLRYNPVHLIYYYVLVYVLQYTSHYLKLLHLHATCQSLHAACPTSRKYVLETKPRFLCFIIHLPCIYFTIFGLLPQPLKVGALERVVDKTKKKKQFSRISALFPGGQIFLSEKHLKKFANHIHLVKMI